jgi:hypothetical protein
VSDYSLTTFESKLHTPQLEDYKTAYSKVLRRYISLSMFTLRYLYLRHGIRAVVLFAHIQVLHAYEIWHIFAHVRSYENCRDVFPRIVR